MFGRRRIASPEAEAEFASPRVSSRAEAPRGVPAQRVRRIRRPRGGLLSLMSGLLTIGVVVGGVLVFGLMLLEGEVERPGPLANDKVVLIPKSSGTSDISEILVREGVIANPTLFDLYALLKRSKGQLKAGEFLFRAHATIDDAVEVLINGKAILHTLTVPEGLTSEQAISRITDNDVLTGALGDTPREGSLMPDTYKFERGMTRQQFVNRMQAENRDFLNKVWARRSPDLAIRTPQELVILASIVEKETGRADERPRIASVFLNRLQRRMKLQSDPTIVYGIAGGRGTLGRPITRSDIDRPTPYNTYTIDGLPPGPIANPGRAALEAVANPMKTRDIYFVADGTGGHVFAETLDQHNRNVARWREVERSRAGATGGGAGGAAPGAPPPAGQVDRAAPPGGQRTEFEAAPEGAPRATSAYASSGGARGFDASEGTSRDPLLNRSWDLSSPKTVPGLSGGPDPAPEAAAKPASRPAAAARRAAAKPAPRQADAEDGPPPGVRVPPR